MESSSCWSMCLLGLAALLELSLKLLLKTEPSNDMQKSTDQHNKYMKNKYIWKSNLGYMSPSRVSKMRLTCVCVGMGSIWAKWLKTAWKQQNQHFWGKLMGDMGGKPIWVVGGWSP